MLRQKYKIIANEEINMYFCPQNQILTSKTYNNGK